MKRKIIDLCIYGIVFVFVLLTFVYSTYDFFYSLAHYEMSSMFGFITRHLFDFGIFIFFAYKTTLCAIALYKSVKEEGEKMKEQKAEIKAKKQEEAKQKRMEQLQAEMQKLTKGGD